MSRKDTLKAMLSRRSAELPGGNSDPLPPTVEAPPAISHVQSGAVGAMGRSLGQIASAAERAKALIASGASVVEIPADKLVGSFAKDRLDDEGAEFMVLYQAIKEAGQKSPILVRPHPDEPERYQIAYGHRRAKILARLGRPVRAVVENLTNEELVVIQGQENSARQDLSYIERGMFALTLEEQGFDRAVIMSALSMEKTQLSRLLSLTKSIPRSVIAAVGPAPKAGRPRWSALAERIAGLKNQSRLDAALTDQKFIEADTDQRFVRLFNALAPKKASANSKPSVVKDESGQKIATIQRTSNSVAVVVDGEGSLEFGEFVATRLPELYRQFENEKEKPT
mgnify:FL=1